MFDSTRDQPAVDGIGGDKAADHGQLHHQPETGVRRVQWRLQQVIENPEMSNGHKAIHANLPSAQGQEVCFGRGFQSGCCALLAHRFDRQVLE